MKPHIVVQTHHIDRQRRRAQYRIRMMMLAILVIAVWLAAFRVPGVGPLILALFGAMGVVVAVFLGVMSLGWLGFGIFALFDRFSARVKETSEWPSE